MHEQLDSDLTKRIAAVFENYEDPGANEGWLLLREKFPVDNRRNLLWFWLSGAAVLLLFLGIGLWRYNYISQDKGIAGLKQKDSTPNNIAAKKTIEPTAGNSKLIANEKSTQSMNGNKPAAKRSDSANSGHFLAKDEMPVKAQGKLNKQSLSATAIALIKKDARLKRPNGVAVSRHSNEQTPHESVAQKTSAHKTLKNLTDANVLASTVHKTDSLSEKNVTGDREQIFVDGTKPRRARLGKKTKASDIVSKEDLVVAPAGDTAFIAQRNEVEKDAILVMSYKKLDLNFDQKPVDIKLPVEKPSEVKNSIYAMFAADVPKINDESKGKSKKVQFGVYEATYLNYAKGSDDQVNVGVGVSSDIYLTENLKLVTGVSIGRNSFNYGGNNAVSGVQSDNVAVSLAAVYGPAPSSVSNFYGISFTPATELKSYNAGLIDLDIPVNLKYEFNAKKNDLYISTGFSSGTFVSETYSYQYNYQASSAPFNQQILGSTTNKSFNNFYFAKTINLAFGAGLPFGKNRLIFEPFLKYPIGGLGSQDIHFGSTGLNLKFKFQ
jgi:hypothetical protein